MKDDERRNPRSQKVSDEIQDYENQEDELITRTINVIAGRFAGGGVTKSAHKEHLQKVLSLSVAKMKVHKPSTILEFVFSNADFEEVVPGHDDPMVILAKMVNVEVKRVLID